MGRQRELTPLASATWTLTPISNIASTRTSSRAITSSTLTIQSILAIVTVTAALKKVLKELILVPMDLFRAIRDAVVPGGIVIYETFTVKQLVLGSGPRSPDHLLEPGELRRHFDDFELLFYEEVEQPEAVARLVGRKTSDRATEPSR